MVLRNGRIAKPGNEIMAEEDVKAGGHRILEMASTRVFKVDPEQLLLLRRKSRFSINESRQRSTSSP